MNYEQLKQELRTNNKTYKDMAEEMGISEIAFKRKMNGVSEFKHSEILSIYSILELSEKCFKEIFFETKVSEKTQKEVI